MYLNVKINFTSNVSIQSTFLVKSGVVSICTNVELLAELSTNARCSSSTDSRQFLYLLLISVRHYKACSQR